MKISDYKNKKNIRYCLRILNSGDTEYFTAESDKEAEDYVEENHHHSIGPMVLYKLEEIVSWGN